MNQDKDDDSRVIATNGTEASKAPSLPDDMLIILPVRNLVLFPGVILPVAIKREKTVAGAQEAVRVEGKVGFLLQKNPETEDPTFDELHRIGTAATIVRYVTAPDGTHHLVCQGERRFRVLDAVGGFPVPRCARGISQRHRGPPPGSRGARVAAEAEGGRGHHAAAAGPGRTREFDPVDRIARGACRHHRQFSRHQADREAGAARNHRDPRAARARVDAPDAPRRSAEAVAPDRGTDQGSDRRPPARIRAARAVEADPERARRRGRRRGNRRTGGGHHQGRDASRRSTNRRARN